MSVYSEYKPAYLPQRRRRVKRPTDAYVPYETSYIDIRIGNAQSKNYYNTLRVSSARDAPEFKRLVDYTTRQNPDHPLVIAVNGYRPWLEDIFNVCIDSHNSTPGMTNREVQFSDTVQFPQKSDRKTKWVPWTFIIDQMNVPEVYYWTFGITPPIDDQLQDVDHYRLRLGAWTCGRGAYRGDTSTAVVMLFTQPTEIAEHIVTSLIFTHLHEDADFDSPRMDEEGLVWLFFHLWDLLSDWQNIIREIERRLDEAELNSRGRNIPVKLRTRSMHKEVDRIYELTEYLRFQSRSFKRLAKLSSSVPESERDEPVWAQTDDAIDDLEQAAYWLDSLKERFNNLIELEFNIENANQSDNSRFLSILGTIFLPISFLASLFGISSVTWKATTYVEIAIPLFVLSVIFTAVFPWAVRRYQRTLYPLQRETVELTKRDFRMMGDQLPAGADVPRGAEGIKETSGLPSPAKRAYVGVSGRRRRRTVVPGSVSEGSEGELPRNRTRSRSRRRSKSRG